MSRLGLFGVFSNVTAIRRPHGRFVLADRLISGMEAHGRYWDGPTLCLCEPVPEAELERNRDRLLSGANVEVHPRDLPFELVVADFDSPEARAVLARLAIAAVGIGHRAHHLSAWGHQVDTAVVFGTEYSLKTRLQIIRATTKNPLRQARRIAWELDLERKQRNAIRIASGVQCSGTPTFDSYRKLNPNAILFFDGRMDDHMLVSAELQSRRSARLRSGGPLKLAWSGRLNRMKGADHLPRIAKLLEERKIPFELDIFGGGVLEEEMKRDVAAMGLTGQVRMRGFVDFDETLSTIFREETDIWICPHTQGDPSGAYMEAFGFGLPIIGYRNEALAGLLGLVTAGESVPVGDESALAAAIADAHHDRERVIRWSEAARGFAEKHTFSKSFERRMRHLEAILTTRSYVF